MRGARTSSCESVLVFSTRSMIFMNRIRQPLIKAGLVRHLWVNQRYSNHLQLLPPHQRRRHSLGCCLRPRLGLLSLTSLQEPQLQLLPYWTRLFLWCFPFQDDRPGRGFQDVAVGLPRLQPRSSPQPPNESVGWWTWTRKLKWRATATWMSCPTTPWTITSADVAWPGAWPFSGSDSPGGPQIFPRELACCVECPPPLPHKPQEVLPPQKNDK